MTQIRPQPGIMEIALYQGGSASIAGQEKPLKLSSNENPFGPGPMAVQAVREAAGKMHLYPSTDHAGLRAAIAEVHGLDPDRIICGVGSDEIITFLCQAYAGPGDEVLYTEHGFLMYKISALAAGAMPVVAPERDDLGPEDFEGVDEDPVRCLDPETSAAMVEEINVLRKKNESLGGTFEVRVFGLVPGLGGHISWEDRLDGRLAQAICSIQSIKGVSIGQAWDVAGRPGSEAHDEIFYSEERGYYRETNHAGGLEGGMTNGMPLSVRAAIKPISTMTKPLRSVDTATREPAQAHKERTDSTVVPAAAVVGEAMICLAMVKTYREKFGGDHMEDVLASIDAYKERIGWR